MTTKFFLDCRSAAEGKNGVVKISVCHRHKTGFISTPYKVLPSQWDKMKEKVINHPEKDYINLELLKKKTEIDSYILQHPELSRLDAAGICRVLRSMERQDCGKEDDQTGEFLRWFDRYRDEKEGNTYKRYEETRRRLIDWLGADSLNIVRFEDIKVCWLEDFQRHLRQTCRQNTIAIHMRNIRAVINYAIANDVTEYYPFKKFKIKTEKTRKRALDVEILRRIFRYQPEEEHLQKYLDFFKLTFFFIGINTVDLCKVGKISNGRIEFFRSKTSRPYSIKVESEAREILDRYEGKERLLSMAEGCSDYRYFYNQLCLALRKIKERLGIKEMTTYNLRHSWATIARRLRIPKDTIALAMGHTGNTVTDIYIDEDIPEEVDEANRIVMDYVLYNKKPMAL